MKKLIILTVTLALFSATPAFTTDKKIGTKRGVIDGKSSKVGKATNSTKPKNKPSCEEAKADLKEAENKLNNLLFHHDCSINNPTHRDAKCTKDEKNEWDLKSAEADKAYITAHQEKTAICCGKEPEMEAHAKSSKPGLKKKKIDMADDSNCNFGPSG